MSVVNLRHPVNGQFPHFDVYIGGSWKVAGFETSKWANPFNIWDGKYTREQCVELYADMFRGSPHLWSTVQELEGKVLACHCKPKPCHGDFLVMEAKKRADNLRRKEQAAAEVLAIDFSQNPEQNTPQPSWAEKKRLVAKLAAERKEMMMHVAATRSASASQAVPSTPTVAAAGVGAPLKRKRNVPRRLMKPFRLFAEDEEKENGDQDVTLTSSQAFPSEVSPLAELLTPLASSSPVPAVAREVEIASASPSLLTIDELGGPDSASDGEEEEYKDSMFKRKSFPFMRK